MSTPTIAADHRSFKFNDFLQSFFRHKRKAAILALTILIGAALVLVFAPRTYRSEAMLYLQIGRESVRLDPTATTGERISVQQIDRSQEVTSVIDVLYSRGILEKLVDELGPEVILAKELPEGEEESSIAQSTIDTIANYTIIPLIQTIKGIDPISQREEAIVRLGRNLSVYAERDSSLITVRYDTKYPKLAQRVMHNLIEIYRSEHLRLHRTSGSKEFFANQHANLESQLNDAVDKLAAAKNRLNLVSIDLRRTTLEERLGKIELASYANLQELASLQAESADLSEQVAAIPERIVSEDITVPNTGTDALREKLYDLQVLQMDQEAKYSSDHPALQNTRKQVKQAQDILSAETRARQETTNDMNPNHQALALSLATVESKLAAAEAGKSALESQRNTILEDLKTLNNHELEIDELSRQVQISREKYFRYAENLEQARIDEELNKQRISNVIVAQPATLIEKPVSPNKLVVIALAGVLTIASVIALVCFCELTGNRIRTQEQLNRAVGLPVLGVVPEDQELASALA